MARLVPILLLCLAAHSKFSGLLALKGRRLPEPFSADKIPLNQETDECFSHIGCIKRFPGTERPMEPAELNAAFLLSDGNNELMVRYEETKVCLEGAPDECAQYPFNLDQLQEVGFDPKLRTVVLIDGYKSKEFDDIMLMEREAWHELEPINFLMVAWTGGNQGFYWDAVANAKVIARATTVFLYYLSLLKGGPSLWDKNFASRFHLVGHSLGAQICSFIAKDFAGSVGSITALDPAGPMFFDKNSTFRVDKSDAGLVQVLHTNGPEFGTAFSLGHLDFYANDGKRQPACTFENLVCNHEKAHEYYLTALKEELALRNALATSTKARKLGRNHQLLAYSADDFDQFVDGSSLLRGCPGFALDAEDGSFELADLTGCVAPMDFVSDHESLREELGQKYGLELSEESRKFFFYAQPPEPLLNTHHLISIFLKKEDVSDCDMSFQVPTSARTEPKYFITPFRLLAHVEHLEAVLPVASALQLSKIQLANLEAANYFDKNKNRVEKLLVDIFPPIIEFTGSKYGGTACASVERIFMKPINVMDRRILALYTTNGNRKPHPDVEFLSDPFKPNLEALEKSEQNDEKLGAQVTTFLYLDTVYIGPLERAKVIPANDSKSFWSISTICFILVGIGLVAVIFKYFPFEAVFRKRTLSFVN